MRFKCPRCTKTVDQRLYGICSKCAKDLNRIMQDRFTVIGALDDVLKREAHVDWLAARNPLLDGESPWDLIVDGRTERVLQVIDLLASGSFA